MMYLKLSHTNLGFLSRQTMAMNFIIAVKKEVTQNKLLINLQRDYV